MDGVDRMRSTTQHHIYLGNRRIAYRVVHSTTAKKLRVRVSPNGVDVVKPKTRTVDDVLIFLDQNATWLKKQVERLEKLGRVRRRECLRVGHILYRGEPTPIQIERTCNPPSQTAVNLIEGKIVVRPGSRSQIPVARTLETWLRRQARREIERHLSGVTTRLRQRPRRTYIMGQRTKWGNCSAKRNLSFNWRLILAPDFVLRYLVTHEAVHLAIPDHSVRFWLTVQSLCRETERAKQWLSANEGQLTVDLQEVSKNAARAC
jgi:predicted metal-dependent hydrolase